MSLKASKATASHLETDGFLSEYSRVTPDYPCPICGRPDWCVIKRNGKMALCQRVESADRFGDAGWRHDLSGIPEHDRLVPPSTHQLRKALPPSFIGLVAEHSEFVLTEDPIKLVELAAALSLNVDCLKAIGTGYGRSKNAYTFPMYDDEGSIVGIRYRTLDGRKFSFRGGREGVFRPKVFFDDPITLVVEGATDTAAGVLLGLNTIGRPNCNGGTYTLKGLLADTDHEELIILSDNDKHRAGLKGAVELKKHVGGSIILPRVNKDLREIVGKYAPSVIRDEIFKAALWRVETHLFTPVF